MPWALSVMTALFLATAMQTLPGALSSTLGGRLQSRLPVVHHESEDAAGRDMEKTRLAEKEIAASNAFWKPSAAEYTAEEQRLKQQRSTTNVEAAAKREGEQSGKTLHDLEVAAKREEDSSKRRVAGIEAARQQGLRDQEAKIESQKKVAELEAARQQGLRDQEAKVESQKKVAEIEAARQQGLRDQEAKIESQSKVAALEIESQRKVADLEAARQQGLRDQDRKQHPALPDPGTLPKLTDLKAIYDHVEKHHRVVKKEVTQPFKAFWMKASSTENIPAFFAFQGAVEKLPSAASTKSGEDMDMLHSSATVTYEAQLPGAYIEGNTAQHGGLLFDSEVSFGPMEQSSKVTEDFFGGLPTKKNAEVVHLGARVLALPFKWSYAFQCFTTDTVPRLVYALDSLRADPELKVLIEGTPVQLEYMDILALDRSRVVTFEPHKAYTASQVSTVLYDWFSYEFMPREAAARFYKEVVLRTHPERPCGDRNLVIYVKRPAGGARSVSNEAELIQSLRTLSAFKHGLELQVYDGNAPVKDAIALFQRAVLVIGAHGGGMANLMFSPPGTLVVEISTPGTYSYAAPAIACQQEYWLVLAKSDADSDAHNKPMTVNINEVTALVGCALSHHADVHTGLSPQADTASYAGVGCSVSLTRAPHAPRRKHTPCGARLRIPTEKEKRGFYPAADM